ncbi:putative sodium/calcium exchanger membrane region [Helianthus annuus]|uniref:Sodium/calcium exchanger membrane region n=1 Tax=Helianthus annuus TaxID=4232 RepID=A0A251VRQ2_HELAN|nr:putative sodium/calcium exchanger membrane region [Helianthus annuus]KAJ0628307.1 putative sodium/calcium exchanger membrane region [Helianthus annuus]KAJ0784590.1 putative sodium/calcium exchanger membrane region [Helianthus annuus]KAJ0949650.1 putative sodium/calcium exchanger membrane region [Helianthus annuus]
MGAVTLLALGNGAPDVFASVAAVGVGNARTGFSTILSAGTFVSALVVGFVAICRAVRGGTDAVWFGGGGGGRVKSGGGDRNVSVEIEFGSGGNMGEFEKVWDSTRV